jgi:hypothetical protein
MNTVECEICNMFFECCDHMEFKQIDHEASAPNIAAAVAELEASQGAGLDYQAVRELARRALAYLQGGAK